MKPDWPASLKFLGLFLLRRLVPSTNRINENPTRLSGTKGSSFSYGSHKSRGQTCRTIAQAPFHVQTGPNFPEIWPFEKQAPRSWPGIAGHTILEFLPGTRPRGGVSLSGDLVGDHPKAPPDALARRRYLWQKPSEKMINNGKSPVG